MHRTIIATITLLLIALAVSATLVVAYDPAHTRTYRRCNEVTLLSLAGSGGVFVTTSEQIPPLASLVKAEFAVAWPRRVVFSCFMQLCCPFHLLTYYTLHTANVHLQNSSKQRINWACMATEAKKRIEKLRSEIRRHDYLYYILNSLCTYIITLLVYYLHFFSPLT